MLENKKGGELTENKLSPQVIMWQQSNLSSQLCERTEYRWQ